VLIDKSYFNNKLFIPNITSANNISASNRFSEFITMCEDEYLRSFFGIELEEEIKDVVISYNSTPSIPMPARIDKIVNGYEFNNITGSPIKWEGLIRANKTSPIADYVSYKWQRNNVTNTTIGGEVMNIQENSINMGPSCKMVDAWNNMVTENKVLLYYMTRYIEDYPDWNLGMVKWGMLHGINTFDF